MSEKLHQTQTPNAANASGKYTGEALKIISTLIAAGLIGLSGNWCSSQKAQDNLLYRVETVEKKAETNAQNILQNSQTLQQIAVRQAEMSGTQTNLVDQIKELKQEQMAIKQMLYRK